MDELYDNLENYRDENIIDELKNENKDLKAKLEEYSSTMSRLQQDLDKLNLEYKKLEMNYSSLLKTARAEIERKSEMIKSLNSEKDIMILKTLQSSGRNVLNPKRYNKQDTLWSNKMHETDVESTTKSQPAVDKVNEETSSCNDRIEQSEDKPSSREHKPIISEEKHIRKQDKSKIEEVHKDVSNTKRVQISNRRKSMPMSSGIELIFSSDDDFEALNVKNIRKSPAKEDIRHFETHNRDNCNPSNKDRFYKYKTNRQDKYEFSSKYKYRSKYANDHYEYKSTRQRVLRSPPNDKYNHSKSRDRRTFERENYHDKQRNSPHRFDYSAGKHKIRTEFEESSSKRQKTEMIDLKTSKRGAIEKNCHTNDREPEHGLRSIFAKQSDLMESTSCQSPDYVNIDTTAPQHVAKEIKHTAATVLEDPRLISKKYVIKCNKSKSLLSTVASENIYIEPINVLTWDIPTANKFIIPQAFTTKCLPEGIEKTIMSEINMSVETPILNNSLDLGEIQSSNDCNNHITDISVDTFNVNKKINENKVQSKELNMKIFNTNKTTNSFDTNKYIIPKINKPNKIPADVRHDDFITILSKKQNSSNFSNENKEGDRNVGDDTSSQLTPNLNEYAIKDKVKHDNIMKTNIVLHEKHLPLVGTLADDLELSDETSDILEKEIIKSKKVLTKNKHKTAVLPMEKNDEDYNIIKSKEKDKMSLKIRICGKTRKSKKKMNRKEISCTEAKELSKEQISSEIKEQNTEPCSTEASKGNEEPSCTKTKLQTNPEPKNKPVKPMISILTKHKFSDLFGDSSSLITPDDLGIPPSNLQFLTTDKYVSIFDNTQDAVLSVEDVNRVQSKTSEMQDEPSDFKTVTDTDDDKYEDKNATEKHTHENININDASKIVKTVIIPTGVQPKYPLENRTLQNGQEVSSEHTSEINNEKANMATCLLNNIKALATSTPHKVSTVVVPSDSGISDANVTNHSNDLTDNCNLSSNTNDHAKLDVISKDADVPDVRIFVKRRRKFINKP